MNIIKRMLCKHEFGAPKRSTPSAWRAELQEVKQTGDIIRVQRRRFTVENTCKLCGFIQRSEGFDQKGMEDDSFDTAKPSKATTNENSYGQFHD